MNIDNIMQIFKTAEDIDCYVSADYHLGKYLLYNEDDPKYEEHLKDNEKIINLHNKVVKKNDLFIFLGDLSESEFGDELDSEMIRKEIKKLIKLLNGKIILFCGNNDTFSNSFYKECGIETVIRKDYILTDKYYYSHYPVNVGNKDLINIHGHIHGSKSYWGIDWHNHIDCYWKLWDGPIRISELKRKYKIGSYIGNTIHSDNNAVFDEGENSNYDTHK